MTKLEKMAKQLNDEFRDVLAAEMRFRYHIEIETEWDWVKDRAVSVRVDKKVFTREQIAFMEDFGDGYAAALIRVRQEAM